MNEQADNATHDAASGQTSDAATPFAVVGTFDDVSSLLKATRQLRDQGYTKWECYSPFPVHGLDRAKGNKPTMLPWIVLVMGVMGLVGGLSMEWWANASNIRPPVFDNLQGYQYIISGKPMFSVPAAMPVVFETTVLLSAFGAVFGMLLLNKLPLLYHPLQRSAAFRKATDSKLAIAIEADDPKFDVDATPGVLASLGASETELVVEPTEDA